MDNSTFKFDKTYIIIGIVIIVLIFVLYKLFTKNTENYEDNIENSGVDKVIDDLIQKENEEYPITSPDLENDMNITWKNQAKNNKYKNSSYIQGIRGNNESQDVLDTYNTRLADSIDYSTMADNDKFSPIDESDDKFSPYEQKKKKFTTSELYDSEKLLPQEVNKDWLEVMPDPIKVKNRHLININKPIGTDTVGSSLKIASHDLRGNIPAPKFVISPFLNSSVEPDINTKGFCN